MIVIGYQGIGKSTLSKKDIKAIDLESSNFRIDGKKADDWYKPYGNMALDLSRQGYIVFTASHMPVRRWIGENNKTDEKVCVCYPDVSLKEEWIGKLRKRFENTGLKKDELAYLNAEERYAANIQEMIDDADRFGWVKIPIESMDYDLGRLVSKAEGGKQ